MFSQQKKGQAIADTSTVGSVIEGLKLLYKTKIAPLEETYKFNEFHSPLLSDSDFDAKPTVMLLGQYSVGKTTFIEYLLGGQFPGSHIGPEPTTDRFVAIMYNEETRTIPGNALAVQHDMPFTGLTRFGNAFLSKFEASVLPNPLLKDITFIDTPGVLSGEKQTIGRSYEYVEVVKWFAERSDLILLLFDAHKLDISDEFKRAILALKGHDDKVRVALNKADQVTPQALMRVYGALMWSLGKVIRTPEVMRVYISSFWEKPYHHADSAKLFDVEREDLFRDLRALPQNAAIRKINELVKRARQARVHALIISHLKQQMPAMFGKQSKQAELIANLGAEFKKLHLQYHIPPGDFPELEKFKEQLANYDFNKFSKLNQKLIDQMDDVLGKDLPALMKRFPQVQTQASLRTNPVQQQQPEDDWPPKDYQREQ